MGPLVALFMCQVRLDLESCVLWHLFFVASGCSWCRRNEVVLHLHPSSQMLSFEGSPSRVSRTE